MFQYRVKDGWGEVKFSAKPSARVRGVLREQGWAWDEFYGCWRKERAMYMSEFAAWLNAEMRRPSGVGECAVIGGGGASCTF